jgi:hypothetical protein
MTPAELKIVENKKEAVAYDPLLTPEQVAKWLNTSIDWVWDHSSRKSPLLPVIRFGEVQGALEFFATGPADRRIYCGAGAIFRIPPQELWP